MTDLGGGSVTLQLITKAAEKELKRFESTASASLKSIVKEAEGVLGKDTFKGGVSGAKLFGDALKPIRAEIKGIVAEAEKLGGAFSKGSASGGATRVKKEVDPLTASIKALANETASYRNVTEATSVSDKEAIGVFRQKKAAALELAKGLDSSSDAYKKITGVAAQAERSLATLEGRQTRLGFSANTLVGINRSLLSQLGSYGPVGNAAAVGFDAFGGAMVGIPTLAGGVAAGVLGVGAATAALVKKGIPEVQAYQKAINVLASSGEEDLGRFKGELEALQLTGGKAAQSFSRSQLAGALAETVKAGLSADEAMGLLRTSTQLAGAESQDLTESTAMVLKNLRQYGLGLDQASRAGDALAAAGGLAASSAADLSEGLAIVGPIAKAANISLEETLGLLINLDNKGLAPTNAGATGLRSVLASLSKPSAAAQAAIEGLGVSLVNVDGSSKGVKERLLEVRDAIAASGKDLTEFAAIADTDALASLLALDETTDQYTQKLLDSQGALRFYSDNMANGLEPAQRRAEASMADLAATAAEVFAPAMTASADGLNRLLTNIDNFLNNGAAGVSTILGIAKAIGDGSDSSSLLGAAEALEKKLSGDGREAVQGLIADLKEGKRPVEDIAAALIDLSRTQILGNAERDVQDATAWVDQLKGRLEELSSGEGINPFRARDIRVTTAELAKAEEELRQMQAQLEYLRGQFAELPGGAEQGLSDAQTAFENFLDTVELGVEETYYLTLSVENPEELKNRIQTFLSQQQFEIQQPGLSKEAEAALQERIDQLTELLALAGQLIAASDQVSGAAANVGTGGGEGTSAPDSEPFDRATASIDELTAALQEQETALNAATPGSEEEAAAAAQIRALNAELEKRRELTEVLDEQQDANAEAVASTTQLASRVGSEFEDGSRKLKSALDALQVPLTDLVNKRAALVSSGDYDDSDLRALDQQIQILETTLDEISPDTFVTLGTGASAAYTPLSELNAASDRLNRTTRESAAEQRQARDAIRDQHVETATAARESAALDAVLKQLQRDLGQVEYREAASNLDLMGEKARLAKEEQEEFARSFRDGKEAAEGYTRSARLTAEQTNVLSDVFGQVRNGLQEAQAKFAITGDATQLAADKTQVYQNALDLLASAGFDPLNPTVQEYAKNLANLEGQTARAEAAQTRLKDAVSQAKTSLDQIKDAAGNIDLETFAEGGAEAAGDYLEELIALRDQLIALKDANLKAFQQAGGNELLQAINGLIPGVEDVNKKLTQTEVLTRDLGNAVKIFDAVTDAALGLAEALGGEVSDELKSAIDTVSSIGSAVEKILSGDILGGILQGVSAVVTAIVDEIGRAAEESKRVEDAVGKYGAKKLEELGLLKLTPKGLELDEAGLAEYEQYLEAIETYGQGIADKFYTVGENGKYAFNEEAAAAFADGLERIQDRADGIAEAMRAAKDATDSVLEAEISADEDTLQAKLDSQDGAYSVDDIFAEQSLAIGRAAQERDEQYRKAAELDAAGQTELANRMRAAADQSFQAELTSINANATQRAEAIGQNSAQFQSDLAQNGANESQRWTDYWNQDAAAQLEAQKNAQIQLRRFQQVLNSERYQELLAAGVSEEVAWQTAANELGYTISETSGDLVSATDAASQQQFQALTNGGGLLANAALNLFGPAGSQITTSGAVLRGQIAGEGSLLSSTISSIFGGAADTAFSQGSFLSSTLASVYSQLAGVSADGSNLFGSTLVSGGNLNIGAIADVGNAIGGQVVGSGKAVQSAQVAAANAQIKQAQEAANKFALNEVKFGNEQNRVGAKVATNRVGNINAAAVFQSDALADFWNSLIDTNVEGNQKYARSTTGGKERVGKGKARRGQAGFGPVNLGKLAGDLFANPSFQAAADYAKPIDPAKYAEQQAKKVGSPGSASGTGAGKGSSGSGKGSSGSGSKGSSGGKKDGSSYTGGKSSEYPKNTPGWYQAKMQEIEEQIKKTSSASKIRSLQAQKAKLQSAYDALMGTGKDADKSAPAGSINEIEERLAKAREAFENATTDATRAQAAERVKVLEAELKEKRKLLEGAAKDAQEIGKATAIAIESPIADLGGTLQYLLDPLKTSLAALPASISSASTGAAASVTQIPESYTSTVPPSYQAQMDVATTMFDKSVSRFDNATIRFDRSSVRIEQALKQLFGTGNRSTLIDEARGISLTPSQFK